MHSIAPIAIIESPYQEKFAVPRQPRLVPSARARVKLLGECNCAESIRGIEQFSHVWLLFLFDHNLAAGWKPTVRPPRLGGNQRMGVFASRATFRPNGIGMSAVELYGVSKQGDQYYLELGSVDLVNGTPIIDIKPYIPYSDAIPDAQGGYADQAPVCLPVSFSPSAEHVLNTHAAGEQRRAVIHQVLAQDPRPAYKKNRADHKLYAVNLYDWNVKFSVSNQAIVVSAIEPF
ncbi:tRNA (N6-threonylcarbamoyladenosine(37)-N6)-methyltransferase TrmO [Vibrio sp. HDW18]|uniref:tRNA (N6-threonylcarbamoyladenosine(37)-N6)-methyltransferase TrmO n=1 Tax=Vibrio sp. HDW18 TaxID=2714948 RepID=UPI00140C67B1|nr:tRNA (N6-threonylcarbamoyladenosine(37)-N6)-methyltransferase TrmO [Vibrio sp. HDW18]QIL86573.1 tRNA (N6-threonylcarbamoyladenosine(37)-N6)-methyltransferase TrmO [Vibrio sp. HDW18]